MNIRPAIQISGVVNSLIALAMLPPLLVSLVTKDGELWSFIYSFVISGVVGLVMFLAFKHKGEVNHRQGFLVVAFSWINASFFSSLPFILSGYFPSITDAIFEATSGITTTGSSILTTIDALPASILFWRSFLHWLGGVGIILISLAILPLLGIGGMQLYRAEMSVVSSDKFAPRIKEMAKSILIVYIIFSAANFLLLLFGGMSLLDSLNHMFATVSTGGFSPNNQSIQGYDSLYIELVTMVFMVLGATNFALHHRFFLNREQAYTKDSEFRFYIVVMVVASVLIALGLASPNISEFFHWLRYSSFQVVSVVTTTGFSSADFDSWPSFAQVVLFGLMFVGGTIGSTTGSIKCIRIMLIVRMGYKELYRLIHPHAVITIKRGGKVVSPEVLRGVMGFTTLYILAFVVSAALMSLTGLDPYSALSSAAANLSNVGPGLGEVGPSSSYAAVTPFGKWVLIVDMLLGRLEIYALIILFMPAFWRS